MDEHRNRLISIVVVMALLGSQQVGQAQVKNSALKSPAYTALHLPEDADVWIPFKCSNLKMVDESMARARKEHGEEAENYGYQAVTGELIEILPPLEEDPEHPGKLIERPECNQLWIELFRVLSSQQMEEREPASTHLNRFTSSLKKIDPRLLESLRSILMPPIVPSEPVRGKDIVHALDRVQFRELGKIPENSWEIGRAHV